MKRKVLAFILLASIVTQNFSVSTIYASSLSEQKRIEEEMLREKGKNDNITEQDPEKISKILQDAENFEKEKESKSIKNDFLNLEKKDHLSKQEQLEQIQ